MDREAQWAMVHGVTENGDVQSMESQRIGQDGMTNTLVQIIINKYNENTSIGISIHSCSRKYLIGFLHFLSRVDGTVRFKMICKFMAYVKRLKIASKAQKQKCHAQITCQQKCSEIFRQKTFILDEKVRVIFMLILIMFIHF